MIRLPEAASVARARSARGLCRGSSGEAEPRSPLGGQSPACLSSARMGRKPSIAGPAGSWHAVPLQPCSLFGRVAVGVRMINPGRHEFRFSSSAAHSTPRLWRRSCRTSGTCTGLPLSLPPFSRRRMPRDVSCGARCSRTRPSTYRATEVPRRTMRQGHVPLGLSPTGPRAGPRASRAVAGGARGATSVAAVLLSFLQGQAIIAAAHRGADAFGGRDPRQRGREAAWHERSGRASSPLVW
jgi:hypothetical protein